MKLLMKSSGSNDVVKSLVGHSMVSRLHQPAWVEEASGAESSGYIKGVVTRFVSTSSPLRGRYCGTQLLNRFR